MVRMRGLEPPWVAPLAPKASASTISPHPHVFTELHYSNELRTICHRYIDSKPSDEQ